MSIISSVNKLNKISIAKDIVKCNFVIYSALYSRRSDSKRHESRYKVVKAKVRLEDESGHLNSEGGPNWELFPPKGNRFYLPGCLGPAWQGASSIINTELTLNSLIDFESKTSDKLHVSVKKCPTLVKENLHEIFPAPEVVSNDGLTLIMLQYREETDFEQGAGKYVLAAREICSRLRLEGYWADFMNPFSGKPFYSYASGKNLYKIDERFRGLNMDIRDLSNCLIISTDEQNAFSGNVFTNAPPNFEVIKNLIEE